MLKYTILILMFAAAVSPAAVKELLPGLLSDNLAVQGQARRDLEAVGASASAPDAASGERKAVCLEICALLESGVPTVPAALPLLTQLERIGGEESVQTLAGLLNHQDEHIRDAARRALVVNPSAAAGQTLVAALKNRRARPPKETAGLVYALGERKEAGVSRMLVGALNSPDEDIFTTAVKALGSVNEDAGAAALLAHRLREAGLRLAMVDAVLLSMNRPEVFEQLLSKAASDQLRAEAALGLLLSGGIHRASKWMASDQPALQAAVIEASLQRGNEDLLNAAAAKMDALPPRLQLQALGALEAGGNRKHANAAEPLLRSEDPLVRDSACRTLARIGRAESVPPLLSNGSREARMALGRMYAPGIDAALEGFAAAGEKPEIRAAAIEALAARNRADLIPVFFKYGVEDDRTAAGAALQAIGAIGSEADIEPMVTLMIAREDSPLYRNAMLSVVQLIRRAGDQAQAVDVLTARLEGASPRSQANILKILAETRSPAALDPLSTACRSADDPLQKAAVKALAGWRDVNGIDTMLAVAGDESLPLSGHVALMRGVSQLYAAQKPKDLNKDKIQQAIDVCRRQEEKDALQSSYDKARP